MDRIELLEPFLQGGIANTNFFNGRLLSAEDLRTEQAAGRQQRAQLGQAIGAGIVHGLRVERATASGAETAALLRVSAGLALNRNGQALALPVAAEVALVRAPDVVSADAGLFAPCVPPNQTAVVAGTGVYVLVLAAASGYEGKALMSGLGDAGMTSPGCGSRVAVEGVQFKLVPLDVNKLDWLSNAERAQIALLMVNNTPANRAKLRNLLAYLCFGTKQLQQAGHDPFNPANKDAATPTYGALDSLLAQGSLTACEVPLALLYWTSGGIQFVDLWAVRRSTAAPTSAGRWATYISARRQREAEAMFLQFQTQLQALYETAGNLDQFSAEQHFGYLPPVGLLPLAGPGGTPGFTFKKFFTNQSYRPPAYIEGAAVEPLVRTALNYGPISLLNKDPFWLYQVLDGSTPRPYLIFVTAYVPYQADARFDFVRWNFSRFYR
jgi:hypothetical protein